MEPQVAPPTRTSSVAFVAAARAATYKSAMKWSGVDQSSVSGIIEREEVVREPVEVLDDPRLFGHHRRFIHGCLQGSEPER